MTVPYQIRIGQDLSKEEVDAVSECIEQVFRRIDTIYNHWNSDSELSRWNQNRSPITSPELISLFKIADRLVKLSEGRFDPTIHQALLQWKTSLELGRAHKEKTKTYGWHLLRISDRAIEKIDPEISIDFDGIVKGFAVDSIAEAFSKMGYASFLIEWGGEIKASGLHPENRPWKVKIAHADSFFELKEGSIATSGIDFQSWQIENGEEEPLVFSHFFDPLLGRLYEKGRYPFKSVSIICESCALADALATTMMLFDDEKKALDWIQAVQKEIPLSYRLHSNNP